MKVIATKTGYYDHGRKKEGAVFNIKSEKDFSALWMEKFTEEAVAKSKTKKSDVRDPIALSKLDPKSVLPEVI